MRPSGWLCRRFFCLILGLPRRSVLPSLLATCWVRSLALMDSITIQPWIHAHGFSLGRVKMTKAVKRRLITLSAFPSWDYLTIFCAHLTTTTGSGATSLYYNISPSSSTSAWVLVSGEHTSFVVNVLLVADLVKPLCKAHRSPSLTICHLVQTCLLPMALVA